MRGAGAGDLVSAYGRQDAFKHTPDHLLRGARAPDGGSRGRRGLRGRGREGAAVRSPAATTPTSAVAVPRHAARAAKGPPLPSTAPATAPVNGPSFDVKQSGPVRELLELPGHPERQAPPGGQADRRRLAPAHRRRELRGRQDREAGGHGDRRHAAGDRGHAGRRGVSATLRRDPPDAGTPDPRAPGSIAVALPALPALRLLRRQLRAAREGSRYELEARGKHARRGRRTTRRRARSRATSSACAGGMVRLTGWPSTATSTTSRSSRSTRPSRHPAPRPRRSRCSPRPRASARPASASPPPAPRESFGATIAVFLLAVAIVMLAARLVGRARGQDRSAARDGRGGGRHRARPDHPRRARAGRSRPRCSPPTSSSAFGLAANLGLIFYLFLVGLELDPSQLKGRIGQAAAISNTSVALPMMLGLAVALPLYDADRARQEVRGVRALHGRGDVDHRLPGARAHPRRAPHAQAPRGRAHAGVRGHRRRDRVVPDRARHRRGRGRHRAAT